MEFVKPPEMPHDKPCRHFITSIGQVWFGVPLCVGCGHSEFAHRLQATRVCATCQHYEQTDPGEGYGWKCKAEESPSFDPNREPGVAYPSDTCSFHAFVQHKFADGTPMNAMDNQVMKELRGNSSPREDEIVSKISAKKVSCTNDALYSPRGLIAEKEITCDPIFLFQYRRWVCSPAIDLESFDLTLGDEGEVYDENHNHRVSEQTLADMEIYVETWITERVFGTREEGEAYGKRRSYDYSDGYRTYCVPCDGKLAELLVKHWI